MRALKIRCFMHVPFEGPGIIQNWVREKNHDLEFTRFYAGDPLPDLSDSDLLIIMGGPMNVFDFHIHPWMEEEIDWVRDYITSGRPVLGICLGAQIIAAALGADVYPGEHKEIGWFNLQFLPSLGEFKICKDLPATRKVFHWHGDTFPIPEDAIRIASSSVFPNQAFIFNRKVIALQFHLEMTPETVEGMVENCGDELGDGPYIQTAEEIRSETCCYASNQQVMYQFLDYLSALNP